MNFVVIYWPCIHCIDILGSTREFSREEKEGKKRYKKKHGAKGDNKRLKKTSRPLDIIK